jgi:hypothetical protein
MLLIDIAVFRAIQSCVLSITSSRLRPIMSPPSCVGQTEADAKKVDEDGRSHFNEEIGCIDRSTADNDPAPCDANPMDRTSDHRGPVDRSSNDCATAGDAAGPDHTASADQGASFHGAQGGEASQQQQRDDHAFHCSSP